MASNRINSTNGHSRQAAEELRRQMCAIRREMGEDIHEIVGQAERLLDWKYYLRHHRWKLAGVAAGVGCVVIWRMTRPKSPPTQPVVPVRGRAQHPDPPKRTKSGLLGNVLFLGRDLLMRSALAYAGQQIGKMLEQRIAQHPPVDTEASLVGSINRKRGEISEQDDPRPGQNFLFESEATQVGT